MKIVKFNEGWKFWAEDDSFALVWNIPDHAKNVTLPHDGMLENPAYAKSPNGGNTGFRDGAVYHYVKPFCTSEADREKTLLLKFEGIHMNAFVYINGQLAAKRPYGYSGFYVALNDYLRYGAENEIRVIVRNSAMTNSRWYSGGGIYRDVYLLTGERTYVEPEGVRVKTEWMDETTAVLGVRTHLRNREAAYRELTLVTELRDGADVVVAADACPITLFEGERRNVSLRLTVASPRLWSAESPYLYHVVTRLMDQERVVDENEDTFGIRTLTVDARHGLRINGRTVKMRGHVSITTAGFWGQPPSGTPNTAGCGF